MLGILAFLGYSHYQTQISKSLSLQEDIKITIKPGSNIQNISSTLKDSGVLDSSTFFELYLRLNPEEATKIKAGDFLITKNMTVLDIVSTIQKNPINTEDVLVLIQEGLRYDEIADIIETKFSEVAVKNFSKSEFIDIAEDPDSTQFNPEVQNFLDEYKPKGKNLEGFLYPETYYFAKDASAKEIIERQILQLKNSLKSTDYEAIESSNYSFYEILNVAGMIEREAFTSEEKPEIADIIYKRLEQGVNGVKLLQIDATILYQAKDWKGNVFLLKNTDGPFNTYTRAGLPPTPISNPGVDSILAAIYPKDNPYFFYLHDSEGNIHYGKNVTEHNANVRKYINN